MFPDRFATIDQVYAGTEEGILLIEENDYLVVTNHDYQSDLGIYGKAEVVAQVQFQLRKKHFEAYEENDYQEGQ